MLRRKSHKRWRHCKCFRNSWKRLSDALLVTSNLKWNFFLFPLRLRFDWRSVSSLCSSRSQTLQQAALLTPLMGMAWTGLPALGKRCQVPPVQERLHPHQAPAVRPRENQRTPDRWDPSWGCDLRGSLLTFYIVFSNVCFFVSVNLDRTVHIHGHIHNKES